MKAEGYYPDDSIVIEMYAKLFLISYKIIMVGKK